ncbi:hypothetical protein GCM10023085_35420 [Actinomadura viridis]
MGAGGRGTWGLGGAGRGPCGPPDGAEPDEPGPGRGADGRGPGRLGAPFLSAGLAEDELEKASVSLRTTGASIVEDADRTNSPISWSLAMTTLLSTPNSLASS